MNKDQQGAAPRILFIAPNVFGLSQKLKDELGKMGYHVDFFDDRFDCGPVTKAIIRKFPSLRTVLLRKKIRALLQQTSKSYDHLLVINGEGLSAKSLDDLSQQCSFDNKTLYLWDSFKNKPGSSEIVPFFDVRFTFDKQDAQSFGLHYLPLFSPHLPDEDQKRYQKAYDISSIFSIHSSRARVMKEILDQRTADLKIFFYMYSPSRLVTLREVVLNPSLARFILQNVHYTPLSLAQCKEIYKKSQVVIDLVHPKQTGLTMRTIECLSLNVKLSTNSKDVEPAKADYIHTFEEFNLKDVVKFGKSEVSFPDAQVFSIRHWLNSILSGETGKMDTKKAH